MIDVADHTVNRSRFSKITRSRPWNNDGRSSSLVVTRPLPVEMGPYSAPVRVPGYRCQSTNFRNSADPFGGPEPQSQFRFLKQFHP